MNKSEALVAFCRDTAEHQMQVVRNDGLYRHLRFRRPGTYVYGFDVITWPGHLAITGDMGASVFTRTEDMLQFFRAPSSWNPGPAPGGLYINSGYWAEKLVANDGSPQEYRPELFKAAVRERFDSWFEGQELDPAQELAKAELWEDIEENVLHDEEHEYAAHQSVRDWSNTSAEFPRFHFDDFWETRLTDYTFHFRWRLYAIALAIQMFDAEQAKVATAAPAEAAEAQAERA